VHAPLSVSPSSGQSRLVNAEAKVGSCQTLDVPCQTTPMNSPRQIRSDGQPITPSPTCTRHPFASPVCPCNGRLKDILESHACESLHRKTTSRRSFENLFPSRSVPPPAAHWRLEHIQGKESLENVRSQQPLHKCVFSGWILIPPVSLEIRQPNETFSPVGSHHSGPNSTLHTVHVAVSSLS
jgi:hypothetical protein